MVERNSSTVKGDPPEYPREVTPEDPCWACGGCDGCAYVARDKVRCYGPDNGTGLPLESTAEYRVYHRCGWRAIPPAPVAVELLKRHFLNRQDRLCHLAEWKKPCPILGGDALDALLLAHIGGRRLAPKAASRWVSRENPEGTPVDGWFRLGAYTPDSQGLTKWLCLDIDGGSDHGSPVADPLAVATDCQALGYRVGLSPYLELSKSCAGWHVWIFFASPIAAAKARALGLLLAPPDALLADGTWADPEAGKGIEIFPKADALRRKGGLGSTVWLPWFHGARHGGNAFWRRNARGFEPFVPLDFDVVDEARVDSALTKLDALAEEDAA